MLIESRIKINDTDITDMIAYNGLKWSRNDVDGPNAGRNMLGTMIRDRIATKIRLDVTCRPLKEAEHHLLLNLIAPVTVTVMYEDPLQGLVQKTMYANNHASTFLIKHPDGQEFWECSFPLIEI